MNRPKLFYQVPGAWPTRQQESSLQASASCRRGRDVRQAGILVCVLVVMIVCGGLSIQSARMLGATIRNCEMRLRMDQLQEMLQLGRIRLKRQLEGENYLGERFRVAVPTDLQGDGGNVKLVEIRIEPLPPQFETELPQWCISATYPADDIQALTVTWESRI